MKKQGIGRREFLGGIAGSAALVSALPRDAVAFGRQAPPAPAARIKFAVIGINHAHINSQVEAVQRGGGELVSVYAKEPDLTAAFLKRFPAGEDGPKRKRDSGR